VCPRSNLLSGFDFSGFLEGKGCKDSARTQPKPGEL